jgi:hypothetical protein
MAKKQKITVKPTKNTKPKNTPTKKATKVTVKEKEVQPKETPKKVESLSPSGGPKRKGITKRKATLAAKKRAAIPKKREPKPPKPKFRWGVISNINMNSGFSMDYLLGRYVKILPTSTETRLNCIIQSPGYEGLELPFSPNEITEVPSKPTKERMYNAYLISVNKSGISFGFELNNETENVEEEKPKTTKTRKKKNE